MISSIFQFKNFLENIAGNY